MKLALLLLFTLPALPSAITSLSLTANGVPCTNSPCYASGPGAGGYVSGSAGGDATSLVYASISIEAACFRTADCISFSGKAKDSITINLDGPEGGTGIIVFRGWSLSSSYGSASLQYSGLSYHPGFDNIDLAYDFHYNQPFSVTASASLGCSECDMRSYAWVSSSVKIYDSQGNFSGLLVDPDGAWTVNPEPATWMLLTLGLLVLILLPRTTTNAGSTRTP